MDRAFCADCPCLVEGDHGEWICDELGKPIEQVQQCPEEGPEREAVCIEEIAAELAESLFEGLLFEEVPKRLELIRKQKGKVIDRVIALAEDKLEDWILEEDLCPVCVKERGQQVTLIAGKTANEFMGYYGSSAAYQTIAVTVVCPSCDYEEEC